MEINCQLTPVLQLLAQLSLLPPPTHPLTGRLDQRRAVKVKVHRSVQRPIIRSSHLNRSDMDHTVFTLQTHHACLNLVSVHQTAPPLTSNSNHLIAAYYSFIDPERMKGWEKQVSRGESGELTWFAVSHLNCRYSERPEITLNTQPTNKPTNSHTQVPYSSNIKRNPRSPVAKDLTWQTFVCSSVACQWRHQY